MTEIPIHEQLLCPYCLVNRPQTEDHWLARSWYPSGLSDVEKPTVPSCRDCNHRKGEIESRLVCVNK